MDLISKGIISDMLKDKTFDIAVDLGCGNGNVGETLKPHVNHLIGVDRSLPSLAIAKRFGYYDEVIQDDIRSYILPRNTDAVFLFYSIEHMPPDDGVALLKRIHVPYILLTTDTKFAWSPSNHHALWSEVPLKELGFKTSTYSRFLLDLIWGKSIIAVKEISFENVIKND